MQVLGNLYYFEKITSSKLTMGNKKNKNKSHKHQSRGKFKKNRTLVNYHKNKKEEENLQQVENGKDELQDQSVMSINQVSTVNVVSDGNVYQVQIREHPCEGPCEPMSSTVQVQMAETASNSIMRESRIVSSVRKRKISFQEETSMYTGSVRFSNI